MKIHINTHGFVRFVDSMPSQNLDESIVESARVSYSTGTTTSRSSRGLIRYLLRNWHTTPFEMVEFKFHLKMPLFVARQWMRHRTASVNETSARYSVVPNEFYTPQTYRLQSQVNKQGSYGEVDTVYDMSGEAKKIGDAAFELYDLMLNYECCREQSRCHLPQSTYTEFYWKINLHNLMHFLHLRMDHHAQKEIRDYACAVYQLVEGLAPHTFEAFRDFRLNSIQLSGPELEALREKKHLESPGENREFLEKLEKMGISPTTLS